MKAIAVDDEPLVLGLLVKTIKEAEPDCEVCGFQKPSEALDAIAGGLRPDVAFLDIEIFGMNGLELAKKIRELSCGAKIIFVTGYPQYALEAYSVHAKGYLLKPVSKERMREELDELKALPPNEHGRIRVQTFGNFEVFVDGVPLRFSHAKTKELLAYLIDRRGASANTGELCAVLWENKPDTVSVRSHLRTLIADLTRRLAELGAKDILVKSRNSFAINCGNVDCDLYRFLCRDTEAVNAYRGEYMAQYSWAEMTLGALE